MGSDLNPISYIEYVLAHKTSVLAPWIIGPLVDIYAAGIYTNLVIKYFINLSPNASRPITLLVALVALLSAIKTGVALYVLFVNAVILNGDTLRWAIAVYQNPALMTAPFTTTIIDFVVQTYYILLLNKLLRSNNGRRFHPAFRWTLLSLIFASFAASLGLGTLAIWEVLTQRYQHPALYITLQLGTSFLGDALISTGTVYCLIKSDAYTMSYRSPIRTFARFIALSATIPAIIAFLNFILVATNVFYNRWQIIFDFALSKAFAISLMWTIEVREKLIATTNSRVAPSSGSMGPSPYLQSPTADIFVTPSMFAATVQLPRTQIPEQDIEMNGQQQPQKQSPLARRTSGFTEPTSDYSDWKH